MAKLHQMLGLACGQPAMKSVTPAMKDDKKSRFLVLCTVACFDDIIWLKMSCTCYVEGLSPFGGDLTLE